MGRRGWRRARTALESAQTGAGDSDSEMHAGKRKQGRVAGALGAKVARDELADVLRVERRSDVLVKQLGG